MHRPHRYALFMLLDHVATDSVRLLQARLSKKTGNSRASLFPVHITVRGRFWADCREVIDLFRRFNETLPQGESICISGPVFRDPDLIWLEVKSKTTFRSKLQHLHETAYAVFDSVAKTDEVAPKHAGKGYVPHVTLGWGCSTDDIDLLAGPIEITATPVSLALVEYPDDWPAAQVSVLDCLHI